MKVKEKRNIADWVVSAKEGDRKALENLCSFYLKRLGMFFKARVRDPFLAEDLVQETMVRFLEGLNRVEDPWAFDAWICKIAKRVALDHYRSKRRMVYDSQVLQSLAGEESGYAVGEERLNIHELLGRALEKVPLKEGALIREHHEKGIPIKVIAEREGISLSGVKMRLLRARRRLRPHLKRLFENSIYDLEI